MAKALIFTLLVAVSCVNATTDSLLLEISGAIQPDSANTHIIVSIGARKLELKRSSSREWTCKFDSALLTAGAKTPINVGITDNRWVVARPFEETSIMPDKRMVRIRISLNNAWLLIVSQDNFFGIHCDSPCAADTLHIDTVGSVSTFVMKPHGFSSISVLLEPPRGDSTLVFKLRDVDKERVKNSLTFKEDEILNELQNEEIEKSKSAMAQLKKASFFRTVEYYWNMINPPGLRDSELQEKRETAQNKLHVKSIKLSCE